MLDDNESPCETEQTGISCDPVYDPNLLQLVKAYIEVYHIQYICRECGGLFVYTDGSSKFGRVHLALYFVDKYDKDRIDDSE
jgi:hypothetical protein